MFSFFRSKPQLAINLSDIGTDMHSHLLPGIDDGCPDVATSLELMKGLQDLGLKKFITTPHILWDLYRNDETTIGKAFSELEQAARAGQKALPLSSAAEYMMDDHFSQLLRNKQPLRKLSGNYVLVEFSFVSLPYDWKEMLFEMQIQGYQPVLAHPERYSYLGNTVRPFQEIADMGILLQVNLNSLTGYYGKPAFALASMLVKQKLVSFVGSDLHHQRHLDALRQNSSMMPLILEILQSGRLMNSTL